MDPVTVGAVMTVAMSVVNAIVKIAQGHVIADVEIARITAASHSDRSHCATPRALIQESPQGAHARLRGPAGHNGGDCHGGCIHH